jgi:hypothetical protein
MGILVARDAVLICLLAAAWPRSRMEDPLRDVPVEQATAPHR